MGFQPRDNYCYDCRFFKYMINGYGCKKFGVYRNDEFDRLCGGRYKQTRQKKAYY